MNVKIVVVLVLVNAQCRSEIACLVLADLIELAHLIKRLRLLDRAQFKSVRHPQLFSNFYAIIMAYYLHIYEIHHHFTLP